MSKTLKTALICATANLLVVIIMVNQTSDAFITIGLLWLLSIAVQIILGLVFAFQAHRTEVGKGILLGSVLAILIGYSVCSGGIGL